MEGKEIILRYHGSSNNACGTYKCHNGSASLTADVYNRCRICRYRTKENISRTGNMYRGSADRNSGTAI